MACVCMRVLFATWKWIFHEILHWFLWVMTSHAVTLYMCLGHSNKMIYFLPPAPMYFRKFPKIQFIAVAVQYWVVQFNRWTIYTEAQHVAWMQAPVLCPCWLWSTSCCSKSRNTSWSKTYRADKGPLKGWAPFTVTHLYQWAAAGQVKEHRAQTGQLESKIMLLITNVLEILWF